jgi:phosphoglycerate dehydrogenase-like enzyme
MPDFNAATVAEHVLMMILALLRRVFDSTLLMKSTQWPASALAARGLQEFRGKILGILGCGAIGREVARRASAFDVEILYCDERRLGAEDEKAWGARRDDLNELLMHSDVLTCHVPHTPRTDRMIGREQLQRMKRTALIINTARGAIIDEEALAEALESNSIAGAGLDVFRDEPLAARHRLRRCPNVVLTPHIAGQTREAMERMVSALLENLRRIADGDEPRYRVGTDG